MGSAVPSVGEGITRISTAVIHGLSAACPQHITCALTGTGRHEKEKKLNILETSGRSWGISRVCAVAWPWPGRERLDDSASSPRGWPVRGVPALVAEPPSAFHLALSVTCPSAGAALSPSRPAFSTAVFHMPQATGHKAVRARIAKEDRPTSSPLATGSPVPPARL